MNKRIKLTVVGVVVVIIYVGVLSLGIQKPKVCPAADAYGLFDSECTPRKGTSNNGSSG